MANRARKWLAVSILFATSGIAVWGLDSPQQERVAEAAAPSGMRFSLPINQQEQGSHVRLESIPPSQSGPAPLAGPTSLFQPLLTPIFGENYRANTDTQSPNLAQQEPSIAINPTNLLNVVVAAKDERAGSNTKQVWIYTSTDGGVTWLNQIFPFAPPSPYSSDPVVNFSDDGICYVTSLPYGGGAADGIQIARSTNGGITFSPGVHLPGTNSSTDKEWTWVDNFPSSPYYHRIYTAYMDFGSGSVWRLNYSSDRGVTWSQPSAPVSAYQFPMPVVLPNGHVLVTYLMAADALAYARSTNGGVSFSGPQLVRGIIRPYCPPDNPGCSIWRLNPIPATGVSPTNGSIVVVWADGNGGRSTTYYTRSTDNGATWSSTAPLAVSPIPNTYQVEPWVEADDRGTFHAIWYDDRENPNTSIFHIYYSQSTDNGATWSNAVRISTATSDLRIGIPSSYNRAAGDYIQVTGWGGNVYAAWTDTRSGTGEDIYVVRGVQPLTTTVTPMPTAPGTFVPTSTMTRTAVPTSTACGTDANYVFTTATATIVPGTVDTGNHCDDCFTQITLPFPVRLYDQTFTQVALDSNGKAHFPSGVSGFPFVCFPIPNATYVIVPYLEDLLTNTACPGGPCGIYTSISGTAPNRIFNIEWRATYFTGGGSANFEIRLYEDQSQGFDVIYGLISRANSGAFAGVQRDQTRFTQYACGQGGDVSNGRLVMYDLPPCPTGTPPTSTRTPTTVSTTSPTSTRTSTPSVTATSSCCPTPTAVGTASCPAPDNYDYAFTIGNSCWRPQFGSTRFYFQAAPNQSGPWDTLDETQDQSITLPPGSTGVNGRFVETAVPTQYQVYRVRMRLITGNCITFTQDFYTNPSPLCRAPVSTNTPTATATSTPFTPTATSTNVPTSTATATNIVASTPTVCASTFTDVPQGHTFYASVYCLACRGIISGYADGTFRPDNLVTRGQLAKIVSNAGNFTESPGTQIFQDVAPDHTFYEWINRLTNRGYMTGYTCGGPGEPCVNNRPYFRPFANATRGQTSKIVANAALIETNIPPTQQTFEDVPPTQTFWLWIERLAARGVMGGYSCGGPGEPCVLPARRAYFRPNNDVTRGQSAKIVANTFFPMCAP